MKRDKWGSCNSNDKEYNGQKKMIYKTTHRKL